MAGDSTTSAAGPDPRREAIRVATESLEDVLGQARPTELTSRVQHSLSQLQEAFSRHAHVADSPQGLHDSIIETDPRLKHTADQLLAEHLELQDRISGLRERMAAAADSTAVKTAQTLNPSQVREAAEDLVHELHRHLERGTALVYEALERDIGIGD